MTDWTSQHDRLDQSQSAVTTDHPPRQVELDSRHAPRGLRSRRQLGPDAPEPECPRAARLLSLTAQLTIVHNWPAPKDRLDRDSTVMQS